LILKSVYIDISLIKNVFLHFIKDTIGFDKHSQTTELSFGIDIDRRQFRRKTDAFLTDRVFRNFAFYWSHSWL